MEGEVTKEKRGDEAIQVASDDREDKDDAKAYKGYGFKEDLSTEVQFKAPLVGTIRFNPWVSMASILAIWAFVIYCAIQGEEVPFKDWKSWIVGQFTWLYIGSQDLWAIFAIVLYCSKYANLKLGKPDEKPEFNDATWFMMLFACGIGVGLFFYGVYEPVYHYAFKNRYNADPTLPDNTAAQIAINITLYHWGIHGWIVYCLVGLLLGLMTYREGLPMTMKSCFYPLIGDRIFGWMGDLIDTVSILTTLFGVCTSLGLGTRQLNSGLSMINPNIPPDDLRIQIAIIWCITAVATISTVSGVGMGIRRLSEVCFGVGMFLMIVVFFADQTFFILNLFVQSIGYYFQYIMQLGWHTDAFEQLGSSFVSNGTRGRFVPEGFAAPDGPPSWIDGWTMFYWGWWISWCPFVGMFIARISRGRTIRQFINGTLTAPVVYSFMWMILFGGIGIKYEREAGSAGLCCGSNFVNATVFNESMMSMIGDNANTDEVAASNDNSWMCTGNECNTCADQTIQRYDYNNATYKMMYEEYDLLKGDFGSTLANRTMVMLSCHNVEQMWFDIMRSYLGIGQFLSIFSLFAIILYFVTSSDSGSLVIDCLASNGDPDPPRIQRVFWALMEGATATALLAAGGKEGLQSLQTAGVISGLPYTIVICLVCVAIWRAVKVAGGDLDPHGPSFECGLFDCWFAAPFKKIKWNESGRLFVLFLCNILMAPFTIADVAGKLHGSSTKKVILLKCVTVPLFALWIICHLLVLHTDNMWAIAWFFYLAFASILTSVRLKARELGKINGNIAEDFFSALFFYSNVTVQLQETVDMLVEKDKVKNEVHNNVQNTKIALDNAAFEDETKNGGNGVRQLPGS